MRPSRVLPIALGAVSVCAIASAALLGSMPSDAASGPRTTTSTTSLSASSPTSTTALTVAAAEPSGLGSLVTSLDSVWAQTRRPSTSCLMVLSQTKVLFERNPDVAVTPASTMKLLTATAILHEMDPHERLRTPVLASAAPAGGVVDGDLYFVGGGDPVLGTADWAASFEQQPRLFTPLETLADRIVAAGIHEVRGRVIGDDGRYDRVRYVPMWPRKFIDDNETGPLSALTVNDGFAIWDRPDPQDVPFVDPPREAAAVLTGLLRARGVTIAGEAAAGRATPNAIEIAAIESPTIAELTSAMLQDSDNGTAELLVKELGLRERGVGSSAAGSDVVRASLAAQGVPMANVVVHDGSGLDHGDHATCRTLASILFRADPHGPIAAGLPIAAQTGTLYKRFLATPVAGHLRAKTGSITGVAALAGYADSPEGRLTFAQVLNGIGTYADARRVQDSLGAALVGLPS